MSATDKPDFPTTPRTAEETIDSLEAGIEQCSAEAATEIERLTYERDVWRGKAEFMGRESAKLRAALRSVTMELARHEAGNHPSAALIAGREACNG